ncbi:MAG TPA: ABC transporter permease [Candidatus Saccharimonadales bacterium]|nr:ABC transporter permease [Candidatus Saccharimonadales bacterium]
MMLASIKAEFRKLWTVRSTYVLFIVAFVLVMIFAFYAEGIKALPASVHDSGKLASEVTNAIMSVSLLGALAGVLLMTHEYRYNTIMYTLTSSNSRTKTLFAKIVAVSAFAVLFALVFAILSPLMTLLGLHIKGLTLDHQQFDVFSLAWRVVFYGWGFSMLGLALAVLLRNQIAVIVTLFMAPATVEPLLGLLLKHNAVYLPFSALGQVLQHQVSEPSGQAVKGAVTFAMSYGRSALVTLLYLVVFWIVAWVLFARRDAN